MEKRGNTFPRFSMSESLCHFITITVYVNPLSNTAPCVLAVFFQNLLQQFQVICHNTVAAQLNEMAHLAGIVDGPVLNRDIAAVPMEAPRSRSGYEVFSSSSISSWNVPITIRSR